MIVNLKDWRGPVFVYSLTETTSTADPEPGSRNILLEPEPHCGALPAPVPAPTVPSSTYTDDQQKDVTLKSD
jgi:hypothetical protein